MAEPDEDTLPSSEEDSSSVSSPDLESLTISEDLVPSTQQEQSQTITLDFSGLLDPPLLLQTDVTQCGGKLWPGGMVLAEYLIREKTKSLEGRTIVELGAGSGLVSIAVALGLRSSGITNNIHITDGLDALIPLIQHNISLNEANTLKSTLLLPQQLSWGKPIPDTLPEEPDVVIAADCNYLEESFPLLLTTLIDLIGEETVCYFCYKKRRRADKEMIRMLSKVFYVKEIEGYWQKERIFLYEIMMNKWE